MMEAFKRHLILDRRDRTLHGALRCLHLPCLKGLLLNNHCHLLLISTPVHIYMPPDQEYFVMEHDFYVGIGLAIVLTYLVKTQGPAFTAEYVNTTIFYG